ncbi:LAMI_0E04192g1_1 [Lachancea mirantina]|uniref:LAMI_0E04192g1_1 n=1 Tax=Lachancea mirantina TaxID=1230905 RepID=A0A1G4JKP1_9SACH|nr:LAMI_0E04192g1_1 [Lachancea mirantina]
MPEYPVHSLDGCDLTLTENPLDDYQRSYMCTLGAQPHALARAVLDDLHVSKTRYRTSAVQGFHDVLPARGTAEAVPPPVHHHPRKQFALECSEYQIPDVLRRRPGAGAGAGAEAGAGIGAALHARPATLLNAASPAARDPADVNCLTKNQQFKLRKIQYSDQRQHSQSQIINPNNCVLWDHQTGYVFFTGIWRLYQDVMHGLSTLYRRAPDAVDRRLQCQLELDYAVARCFYENPHATGAPDWHHRRRYSAAKRPYRQQQPPVRPGPALSATAGGSAGGSSGGNSGVHYSDVHWYNLDPDLKAHLCNVYKATHGLQGDLEFQNLMKRIRGGYIKIQGTWLPYEVCRELCVRFCYPIRFFLVPIFGQSFPRECAEWYEKYVAAQRGTAAAATAMLAAPAAPAAPAPQFRARPKKVDAELLDASQNLLDISRRQSVQECNFYDRLSAVPVPVPQFRTRSFSWAPGNSGADTKPQQSAGETLPPIKSLFESLDQQLYPSPPISAGMADPAPWKDTTASTASAPHSPTFVESRSATHYRATPPDSHFVMMRSPSYAHPRAHPPLPLANLAHFYNSHGHRYVYPGGMQAMYHPRDMETKDPNEHSARIVH